MASNGSMHRTGVGLMLKNLFIYRCIRIFGAYRLLVQFSDQKMDDTDAPI